MSSFGAMEQALGLFERPDLASVIRVQPLPPGVLDVIRVAANHAATIERARAHTGRDAETLREAAAFYVQQALFASNGDPVRTIGAPPDAPYETLRTHAHTLLKWLHPDAVRDDWEAAFAERVATAWDTLKRERGRMGSRGGPRREGSAPQRPTTSDGRPKLYRTSRPHRPPGRSRRRRTGATGNRDWSLRLAPRRLAGVAAGLLALALVGYQVVVGAMAESLARTDPLAALAWRSGNASAHAEAARLALAESTAGGSTADAENHLRAALSTSPVAPGALRMLGLVAAESGDEPRAEAIMTRLGHLSRRDSAVQMWLMSSAARSGDYRATVERADTLLRTRPDLRPTLVPVLMELAMAEETRPAFVDVLMGAPPWREWFFVFATARENGAFLGRELMTALIDAGGSPTPTERASVINAMISAGAHQFAFLTWSSLLPPEQASAIPYVYNGDFERPPSGILFDWAIRTEPGARTEVLPAGDGQGRALRVSFSGRRVAYRHLAKMLLLSPGAYRLTGLARAEELETERGLRWSVTCAGDPDPIAATPPMKGTFAWSGITLDIVVPAGCAAQVLRLELVRKARLDEDVRGAMWFDDLAIERLPPGG